LVAVIYGVRLPTLVNNAIYKTHVIIHVTVTYRKDSKSDKNSDIEISHHITACYWDTGLLFVLHVITSIATKRFSHLLQLPRTGSYPLTPAQNQGAIILVSSILLSTTFHLYFTQLFTASHFCLIVHLSLFIIPARH